MAARAGDELIERIRAHPADDDVVGVAANDLLSELFGGYPAENLRLLLHAGDDMIVRTGTWLLSELGDRAAPLLDEVPALLGHHVLQVRYFAVDVVLANTGPQDGPLIARTLSLVADPEKAVRSKLLRFLAAIEADRLAAGAACLEPGPVRELAEWLAAPRDVAARLGDPDRTVRLFATAAAARLAEHDPGLLELAAAADDEEIRSFAARLRGGAA